jgi:hypothetical protein
MTGSSPREAIRNFLTTLQQAISCVTDAVVVIRGVPAQAATRLELTLNNGHPSPLSGDSRIAIRASQYIRVLESADPVAPWSVSAVSYLYSLDEAEGQEILGYHWHPNQDTPITFPHLHLRAGARVGRAEFDKAHLPTGYIAIEDVLRLAIRDFGVRPRRRNWAALLDRTQRAAAG